MAAATAAVMLAAVMAAATAVAHHRIVRASARAEQMAMRRQSTQVEVVVEHRHDRVMQRTLRGLEQYGCTTWQQGTT